MHIIESWGTGIPRLYNKSAEYGLPEPLFEEFGDGIKVTMFRKVSSTGQHIQNFFSDVTMINSFGDNSWIMNWRAFLKNSPVLLLDEATSALDSQSEEIVQKAVERLMANRTSIVIAHRLSTIQSMDRILVMEQGKVLEEGTHKELLKNKGRYYQLYCM